MTAACLADLLGQAGHKTLIAPDVRDAENLVDAYHPDAAIIDYLLPGGDGLECLKALRKRPFFTDAPAVFQTAVGDKDLVDLGRAAQGLGPVGLVRKPCSVEDIVKALREAGAAL
jgi:two-component system phosphate regulon response regulator PhoB